jgi:two-component sensor histidine kinase
MSADTDRLTIQVTADDSAVEADVSVSLGLIVTELVINASSTPSGMSDPVRS